MKKKIVLPSILLIASLICIASSFSFDLSQTDKHGSVLSQASCNKDTVIDFFFSPNTAISNCSPLGCSIVNFKF